MISVPAGTLRWSRLTSLMTASSFSLSGLNGPHARKAHSKQFTRMGKLPGLFAAHGVLQTADRVLHLALHLIGFAFGFRLLVAQDLAGPFLHFALGLLGGAFYAIFVDHFTSPENRFVRQLRTRQGAAKFHCLIKRALRVFFGAMHYREFTAFSGWRAIGTRMGLQGWGCWLT